MTFDCGSFWPHTQLMASIRRRKLYGYSQTQLRLLRGQNLSEASESAAADIQSPREQTAANENLVVSTYGIHCRYRNSVPKKKSPATPLNCRGRRLEAGVRIELTIGVLQTPALPLG